MSEPSIFPLPLTFFERYMFLDDLAGNSMTFPLILRFRGRFERSALDAAFDAARRAHPLLLCTVSPDGKEWNPAQDLEGIWWQENRPETFPWPKPSIDIVKEPGLKLAVYQDADGARLDFLLHHCVTDGLGFNQFLDTLFTCYCRNVGLEIEQKEYDVPRLKRRAVLELEAPPHPVPWYRALYSMIRETVFWLRSRPVSPVSSRPPATDETDESKHGLFTRKIRDENVEFERMRWSRAGFLFAALSRDTTDRIVAECKKRKKTVGDYLLSRLFLSTAQCPTFGVRLKNGSIRPFKANDLLRIGVVCNMRGRGAGEMPACNIISYAFPSRKRKDCVDTEIFQDGVSRELYIIKKWHVGSMFLNGLAFFSRIPGMLRRIVRNENCLASVMHSSLNRLESGFPDKFRKGENGRIVVADTTLLDFRQAAPCRKGTHISVTTFSYAGSLNFHVRYDPALLSLDDVADWLATWLEQTIPADQGENPIEPAATTTT